MTHQLIVQLKRLKHGDINPRPVWVEETRRQLFAQIKNTLPAPGGSAPSILENFGQWLSFFLPRPLVYNVLRPIAIFFIAFAVGTSSLVTTVDAAYEALPGDVFYPAKRGLEKTHAAMVSLIGDNNDQAKLHLELAKRRAVEVKKLITRNNNNNNLEKSETVAATVAQVKQEIATVNKKLSAVAAPASGSIQAGVAREVKEKAEQVKEVLQEVKNNLQTNSSTTKAVLSEVSQTKNLVQDVSVKAMEVLVTKYQNGDQSVSSEEVTRVIATTLQNAATEMGESKQNVDGLKTMVETAKSEVTDLGLEPTSKLLFPSTVTTTTQELVDKISTVANQTVAAVLKTEAVSAEVGKKITEAKELVGAGNLAKAMEKVKELNEATKEAERISDTVIVRTQMVLPGVQVIKESSFNTNTSSSFMTKEGFVPTNLAPESVISSTPKVVSSTAGSGSTGSK